MPRDDPIGRNGALHENFGHFLPLGMLEYDTKVRVLLHRNKSSFHNSDTIAGDAPVRTDHTPTRKVVRLTSEGRVSFRRMLYLCAWIVRTDAKRRLAISFA